LSRGLGDESFPQGPGADPGDGLEKPEITLENIAEEIYENTQIIK